MLKLSLLLILCIKYILTKEISLQQGNDIKGLERQVQQRNLFYKNSLLSQKRDKLYLSAADKMFRYSVFRKQKLKSKENSKITKISLPVNMEVHNELKKKLEDYRKKVSNKFFERIMNRIIVV